MCVTCLPTKALQSRARKKVVYWYTIFNKLKRFFQNTLFCTFYSFFPIYTLFTYLLFFYSYQSKQLLYRTLYFILLRRVKKGLDLLHTLTCFCASEGGKKEGRPNFVRSTSFLGCLPPKEVQSTPRPASLLCRGKSKGGLPLEGRGIRLWKLENLLEIRIQTEDCF